MVIEPQASHGHIGSCSTVGDSRLQGNLCGHDATWCLARMLVSNYLTTSTWTGAVG